MKYRTRACDNPAPSIEGKSCEGLAQEGMQCNSHACPGKITVILYLCYSLVSIVDDACVFRRVKHPILSILLHAPQNNRSLAPVKTKTVTEAREA